MDKSNLNYKTFTQVGTGSHPDIQNHRLVECPIGKYVVKVIVGPTNEFMGIAEIGVSQNFMSRAQRIATSGYHDIEEFYRSDE